MTMKHLGVDYGSKKIGLALSDEGGSMGFPHSIIPNTPKAVEQICALMAKEDVRALVMGDSKDFSGKDNKIAPAAHALGDEVAARCGVPVFYESETLTSAEARRAPAKDDSMRKSRAPSNKGHIDSSAAALILTSYLNKHAT